MIPLSKTSLGATLLSLFTLWAGQAAAAPRAGLFFAWDVLEPKDPSIARDFPDPAIIQGGDGWYAFATRPIDGSQRNVQWAKAADPEGPWTYIDSDLLPNAGAWQDNANVWAPDVRQVTDGTYVMYYSAQLLNSSHHCIGAATATDVTGPWTAKDEPWACDLEQGGSIDPSGFYDEETGRRKHHSSPPTGPRLECSRNFQNATLQALWQVTNTCDLGFVVYKIDGNSIGNGGNCNNGVEPIVPTPIMLQEVGPDGITRIGEATQILDRTDADGPLVEAPNLIKTEEGSYALFYSSWCYTDTRYDVKYVLSKSVEGPYKRTRSPSLVETSNFGLTSPGGATSIVGGGLMVFHANCDVEAGARCMYTANFTVTGRNVLVN
jgi:beta-xylosidase